MCAALRKEVCAAGVEKIYTGHCTGEEGYRIHARRHWETGYISLKRDLRSCYDNVTCSLHAAGFFLDIIFGDPVWLYHPVRLIGKGISFGERQLRKLCGLRSCPADPQLQGKKTEDGQPESGREDSRKLVAAGACSVGVHRSAVLSDPVGTACSGAEDPSGAEVCTGDVLVLSDHCGEMPVQRERESL